jgi:hypothetical protein
VKKEYLDDPRFGIVVYKNSIPEDSNIPMRLETSLRGSSHEYFKWHDSLVGEGVKMPDYRDCVDFKMDQKYIPGTPEEFSDIVDVYTTTANAQRECLKDYCLSYNISMNYMEAINFVRYGVNEHFSVHTDHGFSYICTVSCVTYFNDDYEGGELYFPYLDLTWKPEAGDSVFFPSTFIYAHASKPVTSGIKYSGVTMFDYNDDAHQHGGFSRDFGQSYSQPEKPSFDADKAPVVRSGGVQSANSTDTSVYNESKLRELIREEIQNYAMESWKQWQSNGGDMSQMGNYQKYVAGAR